MRAKQKFSSQHTHAQSPEGFQLVILYQESRESQPPAEAGSGLFWGPGPLGPVSGLHLLLRQT